MTGQHATGEQVTADDHTESDLVAEIRALRVEIRALLAALRVGAEALDEPALTDDLDAEARALARESLHDSERERRAYAQRLQDSALAAFQAGIELRERRMREALASTPRGPETHEPHHHK
jgi:hypothetical protein